MFKAWSVLTTSPCFTVNFKPAGTTCEVTVPSELVIVIVDSFFSVVATSEIWPAWTAPKLLILLFSPVGYTWPRPRFPPAYNGYVKYLTFEFLAGSGATTGKISSWCVLPAIGPTTKILSNSVLYGEINTPLFFVFTSWGIWFFWC